ncbi:otospiralin-like, partial [Osmerus eperlanus]|uniref:otospiralin-like n=1 Tax=Osmerus eperlanus TaxID=29151 RepID=UPI002E0E8B87
MCGARATLLLCSLYLGLLCQAGGEEKGTAIEEDHRGGGGRRERRSMPYWNMWSSDFVGWMEELRAQGGYDRLDDLARTFWAHFPIATGLGYDEPEPEIQETGEGVPGGRGE